MSHFHRSDAGAVGGGPPLKYRDFIHIPSKRLLNNPDILLHKRPAEKDRQMGRRIATKKSDVAAEKRRRASRLLRSCYLLPTARCRRGVAW